MTKFKCNQCGKDTVYQSGMTLCPYCQSAYPDSEIKLMSESADILGSIDTAKASATLAAPLHDEDDEVSVGSSKTALAADLGYVDNPRHMKSLTTELAYGSTAGRSSAIPTRTVGDEDSDSEIRDYKLEMEIGQGSFGTVYRAVQVPLDRSVAIKLLKPLPLAPSTEGDQSKASRVQQETRIRDEFLREAQFTGKLEHPNIVPIHDIGIVSGGKKTDRPFYVMKEIKGISWQDVFAEKSRDENLDIFGRVVDAIAFAHSRDILHCDLKPENVMLGEFGEVLVVDWGQAINTTQPETFRPGGTPAYCSPEMAQYWCDYGENPNRIPESSHLIGPRSDVYLLGSILFQMVTGRAPHFGLKGETPADVMRRASKNEIRRHDQFVSDELMQIALRALRKMGDEIVTVSQLQAELKSYEERKRSIDIRDRAFQLLEEAKVSSDYDTYQKAKFGFEESLALWKENPTAREGLHSTRLSCAELALTDQNFDLGLGMLADADNEDELKVKEKLVVGKRKRDRRKQLVYLLGLGFAAAVLIGGGFATYQTSVAVDAYNKLGEKEKEISVLIVKAESADEVAKLAEAKTQKAEQKLEELKPEIARAEAVRKQAESDSKKAKADSEEAKSQVRLAKREKEEADRDKAEALKSKQLAIKELEATKESSELLVYKTRISSIVEKIDRGDFNGAKVVLDKEDNATKESFEWNRLSLMAHPEVTNESLFPEEYLMGAELSGDRNQVALCFNDRIEIRQTTKLDKVIAKIKMVDLELEGVERIALSEDGSKLAVASGGNIHMVDTATGKRSADPLRAQSRGISDLAFSNDGSLLLSVGEPSIINSSAKKGERGLMVYEFDGGSWDQLPNVGFSGAFSRPETAEFSKDGNRIVTSSPGATQGKQFAFVLERKDDTFDWIVPKGGIKRQRKGEFFKSVFADDQGKQVISSYVSRSGAGLTNQIVVWNAEDASGTMQISTGQDDRRAASPAESYPVFESAQSVSVSQPIRHLDFSGNVLLATSEKQMLYWNLPGGDLTGLETTPGIYGGHGKPIEVAGILNAGSKFMTVSTKDNPEILLTNTTTYRDEEINLQLAGRALSDESSPSAFSESVQKDKVIVGNDHGLVSINSFDSGKSKSLLQWQVSAWDKHQVTKKHLFALSDRDDLYRYNLESGELETILTKLSRIRSSQSDGQTNKIFSIDISDDSRFAVVQRQNEKSEFEIWNLENQTGRVVSFGDKTGLEESNTLPILTISDDGNWIAGARIRFYVWQNDGTYAGDAGVENNVKELIGGLKFVAGTSQVAVGRKNVLKVYDVSGGNAGLSRYAEYKIKDFPASPRRPNVVDAREVDGKTCLLIRKVFKKANAINESGLDLIRLDDNKNFSVLQSVPGAQQASISRSGKMLAVSLEKRSLLQFDIKTGTMGESRKIVVAPREVAGEPSEARDIFSGVFEAENGELVLNWTSNNRQSTVSVNAAGELSNLSVIATPILNAVELNGNRAVTFENGSVRFWDLDFESKVVKPAGTLRGNFGSFDVSPDGQLDVC